MSSPTAPDHTTYPTGFRQKEVARLLDVVSAGESASVVGVSGVGKSNLFNHLLDKETQQRVLQEDADHYLFLRTNFHYAPDFSDRTVYTLILEQLEQAPGGEVVTPLLDALLEAGRDPLSVQRYFRLALRQMLDDPPRHLVLLFDQFDGVWRHGAERLFANLRGLRESYRYRLSYLVFSRTLLPTLVPMEQGREEFYELLAANVIGLRPYGPSDAQRMVQRISARYNLPLPVHRQERYYELSGGHAGLLRAIYLADARGELDGDLLDGLGRHDNVLQECHKLWSGLTAEEKKVLALQANNQSLPDESPQARRQLQLKGLLVDGEELFSPIFRDYIRTQAQPWEESIYLEDATGRLWVGGKPVSQLEPTPATLLAELLANANDLVPHEELKATGWGPDEFDMIVSPEMLHAAISRVRRAIKAVDDPELKVEAIRGKGYCLHVPDTYNLSQATR